MIAALGRGTILAVPFLTCLLAVLVDTLPLPLPRGAPGAEAPFVTAAVLVFWSLTRPHLVPPLVTFAVGIAVDAASGLPLGASALGFLLVRIALSAGGVLKVGPSFLVLWIGATLSLAAVALLQWGVLGILSARIAPVRPLLLGVLLTALAWPFLAAALTSLARVLPTVDDAPGS